MKPLFHFLLTLFFLSICCSSLLAQDIHLLQYNSSPQNLNPAQTGLFAGDWRFVGNYRTQWSAIPVPYTTYSMAADTRLNKLPASFQNYFRKSTPALGLVVNTDKAGDSKLSTTQFFLSASFIRKLTQDSTHFISLGVQPGITNKSFNTADLSFDKQYNGTNYDANSNNGENFASTSITYFDIGAGAAYYWEKTKRKKVNVGISLFHLNQPKQSFFYNNAVKLDMKINISGTAELPIAEKIGIVPTFLIQRQGTFKETDIGLYGKYYLTPVNGAATALSLGAFYRAEDAWVIAGNMEYRNFNVGISYDINTSPLNAATNNRGAFELSVIYILKKIVPFVAKKRVCPIYM
jgi:type IX secretion system PorP/SprF family membrane protein